MINWRALYPWLARLGWRLLHRQAPRSQRDDLMLQYNGLVTLKTMQKPEARWMDYNGGSDRQSSQFGLFWSTGSFWHTCIWARNLFLVLNMLGTLPMHRYIHIWRNGGNRGGETNKQTRWNFCFWCTIADLGNKIRKGQGDVSFFFNYSFSPYEVWDVDCGLWVKMWRSEEMKCELGVYVCDGHFGTMY